MLRLLYVSYASPVFPQSGYSYRAFGVLRWLVSRYRVSLVFEGRQEDLAASRLPVECFESVEVIPAQPRLLQLLLGVAGRLPYHHRRHSSPAARLVLQRSLASRGFDLVWLNKTVQLPAIERVENLPPIVIDQIALESVVWDNLIRNDPRWWAKPFYRWNRWRVLHYERRAYRRLAGVVCITPEEHRLTALQHPGVPSVFVPQGVDPDYYRPAPKAAPDPDVLLFSGTGARRNIEAVRMFIQDVLPRVQQRRPASRLLWIGNVNIADHPFLRRVDLDATGFVQDTPPFFDRGRIFVSPFTMGEGMKTKVVEALAMGKVVVGTTIGLAGIDPTGLPFVKCVDDPAAFASAILEFREDPGLPLLCEQARKWAVTNYAWDTVLEPLGPFLDRAVASRRSPAHPQAQFPRAAPRPFLTN